MPENRSAKLFRPVNFFNGTSFAKVTGCITAFFYTLVDNLS